ncbi:hypothetical protein WA577_000057 [Blastocystis sp. JDR]
MVLLPSLHSIVELIDNIRFIRVFRCMSLMVYCASLFVCESVRKSKQNENMTWIESLILCFIGQFGGTTLVSICIGQPIRFLTSDKVVVALLAAWLTIFWTPFDLGLKAFGIPAIRLICYFFQLLSISFSVTAYGVDFVFKSDHPKAMVGLSMLIVTGTISGCGGSVLLHYHNYDQEENALPSSSPSYYGDDRNTCATHTLPDDLIRPTFAVKRAFFSTLLYIYLSDPLLFIRGHPLFDAATCHVLTFVFLIVTTILDECGWNVFDSISSLFHHLTFVPKEIPAFARRWSFEGIQEKSKDL